MIVGIIGAGTMGSGIAQAFAQCEGFEVRLCDITAEFAARGKDRIENQLTKRVQKGKMTAEAAQNILDRITTGTKGICT
ncbi:MAG: 3-hydroxybutyryl-CoA dehydrogenase, partial [Clostridia bacterium]|nr:3-hydroxybutyryl-CoA dehydrogenase [Clostridia bacterium]